MVDRQARRQAKAISEGAPIPESADKKTVVYGLAGLALAGSTLGDRLLTKQPPTDFRGLEKALTTTLEHASTVGFNTLHQQQMYTMNVAHSSRYPDERDRRYSHGVGLERMLQGCNTGAHIEIMALRTIAQRQHKGEQISLEGIYASSRVPFTLAMFHLSDFLKRGIDDMRLFQDDVRWLAREGGDGGKIFGIEDVRMDPESGLSFVGDWEVSTDEEKAINGLHIGCPATLIKDYIDNTHMIAVNAALEAGLISAS